MVPTNPLWWAVDENLGNVVNNPHNLWPLIRTQIADVTQENSSLTTTATTHVLSTVIEWGCGREWGWEVSERLHLSSLEAKGNSLFFLVSVRAISDTSSPFSFTIGSFPATPYQHNNNNKNNNTNNPHAHTHKSCKPLHVLHHLHQKH